MKRTKITASEKDMLNRGEILLIFSEISLALVELGKKIKYRSTKVGAVPTYHKAICKVQLTLARDTVREAKKLILTVDELAQKSRGDSWHND